MTLDIASVHADDGVEFDTNSIDVHQIRDDADYPSLQVRLRATLHTARGTIVWDVSTGDPIVPAPQPVRVPRALGDDIDILGYAPETAIAEKGVTILERGITSTRWRDYRHRATQPKPPDRPDPAPRRRRSRRQPAASPSNPSPPT